MKVTRPAPPSSFTKYLPYPNSCAFFQIFFISERAVDDHIYVNKLARIPCVDINNYDADNPQSSFGSFWHTVNDTMENIDRNTQKAVGQTVMDVI